MSYGFVALIFVVGVAVGVLAVVGSWVAGTPEEATCMANIIIAIATVTGVTIHCLSRRDSQKRYVWELNKEYVLELIRLLHRLEEALDKEINYECEKKCRESRACYDDQIDTSCSDMPRGDFSFNEELDGKLSNVETFLLPYMECSLKKEIFEYKQIISAVNMGVYDGAFDNLEALENEQEATQALIQGVTKLAYDLSGVGKF